MCASALYRLVYGDSVEGKEEPFAVRHVHANGTGVGIGVHLL